MGRIRGSFDAQFKARVCEAIQSGHESIGAVCREYQLSRSVVDRWLLAFADGRLSGRQGGRERELERENERLKAKVGEPTMAIDLLKKDREWQQRQRDVSSSIITASNLAEFQRPATQPGSRFRRTTTKGNGTR